MCSLLFQLLPLFEPNTTSKLKVILSKAFDQSKNCVGMHMCDCNHFLLTCGLPGRTGRAGRPGKAITFFTEDDSVNLRRLVTMFVGHQTKALVVVFTN